MSEKYIPEHIDPYRFAEQGLELSGSLKIAEMHRVGDSLREEHDKATVNLKFGIDEQGITFLKGHLETQLTLQCQRCMKPVVYEIISDFILGIVNTLDEANALPERYEPALTKDGTLALRELIEDEIILNLPIIPRHEPDACEVKLPLTDPEWEQGEGKNPFHVLQSLKDKEK